MRILMVCLGNICRSPSAEAVLRARAEQRGLGQRLQIDSAGTGDWHVGKPPDARSQAAAARRGYRLDDLRARQVRAADFQDFDLLLAMDQDNLHTLRQRAPASPRAELALLLTYAGLGEHEVPDPYYGGEQGFEQVLDLLEQASDALLDRLEPLL